jgi:hypothetical protein
VDSSITILVSREGKDGAGSLGLLALSNYASASIH